MYKLVLFDLDGTLLNSLEDLAYASNYALEQSGFETHEVEAYKTFVGNGVYKLIERALPTEARIEETITRVKKIFDAYYDKHSLDHTRPYEGILDILHELKSCGIKMAVVSNKPNHFTKQLVALMFEGTIDSVYGQREGIPAKPDPTTVLEVIETLGIQKEECIYIGDSNVDIYTAQNAGIEAIGVLWGFRTELELKEAGAKRTAKDTKELLQYILK